MTSNLHKYAALVLLLGLLGIARETQSASEAQIGILLLAHGGARSWNQEVAALAANVDKTAPVEVAFGMASKGSMQKAIDKLVARHVREIVAVPMFVSSHSSVITSTQYLLGLRADAPEDLAMYAGMHHGHDEHAPAAAEPPVDPATPIHSPVPIRMAAALDAHPIVADILLSRAQAISKDPEHETVLVVAHGPVSEEENAAWLADMSSLAAAMRRSAGSFRQIRYLTVRDDAPDPIRSQATAELRATVERAAKQGDRVLIVPLLISYGGIETGIRKRLEGLPYTMSPQALLPDDRLASWVLESARAAPVALE